MPVPMPHGLDQKLPIACDRCRKRKQKCDRSIPSCRRCALANARCTLTNSNQTVSIGGRGYVEQLEYKLQLLQGLSCNAEITSPGNTPNHGRVNDSSTVYYRPATERQEAEQQAISGGGSGEVDRQATADLDSPLAHLTIAAMARESDVQHAINFTLPTSISFVSACNGSKLTQAGEDSPSPTGMFGDPKCTNLSHVMANIPRAEALRFIDSYFHTIHPLFPCSDRPFIVEMFLHVSMRPTEAYQKVEELISVIVIALGMMVCGNHAEAQFLADCVASQSSSYFTACLDELLHTQALVLLSVWSLFQPRAGLTWHYVGLTTNRVIALGLHRLPVLSETSSATQAASSHRQHVKILWSAYCLDRLTSLALGKPFSFQDCDITTPRPTPRRGAQEFPDIIRLVNLLSEIRRAQGHHSNHLYYQLQLWRERSTPAKSEEALESTAYTQYCEMLYLRGLLLLFESNPARFQVGSATASEVMGSCEKMVDIAHGWAVNSTLMSSWITGCYLFSAGVIYLHIVVRDQYTRSRQTLTDFMGVVSKCGAALGSYAQIFSVMRHYRDVYTALARAVSVFLERELHTSMTSPFEHAVHCSMDQNGNPNGINNGQNGHGFEHMKSLQYITDASANSMIRDIIDTIPNARMSPK